MQPTLSSRKPPQRPRPLGPLPTRAPPPAQPSAPSSLSAVVPGHGLGDLLLPGRRRLGLTVRTIGEKPRHGDGTQGLRRARPEPEENRGVRAGRQPRLPPPDPVPGHRLLGPHPTPSYPEHEAQETQSSGAPVSQRRGETDATPEEEMVGESLPGSTKELQFPVVFAPSRAWDEFAMEVSFLFN